VDVVVVVDGDDLRIFAVVDHVHVGATLT